MRHPHRHSHHLLPLMLIAVGAALLTVNTGLVPAAEFKALLGQWWPLELVVAGIALLAPPRHDGGDDGDEGR